MAKVRAPLLSLKATGRIGDYLAYRQEGSNSIVCTRPLRKQRPSIEQQDARERFKLAAKSWKNLPQQTKDDWIEYGYDHDISGYQAYQREYYFQAIEYPHTPEIP